jgi:hypothetical protein
MSRSVVDIVYILIANTVSTGIVYDDTLFSGLQVRVVLKVELSNLESVLLALDIYGTVRCMFVSCK